VWRVFLDTSDPFSLDSNPSMWAILHPASLSSYVTALVLAGLQVAQLFVVLTALLLWPSYLFCSQIGNLAWRLFLAYLTFFGFGSVRWVGRYVVVHPAFPDTAGFGSAKQVDSWLTLQRVVRQPQEPGGNVVPIGSGFPGLVFARARQP
jgi:hypothetical protein